MKRPIPEGVTPPNENTVILGYGGEFQVPRDGFDGWMRNAAAFDDEWVLCHGHGNNRFTIYAANAGSEVARLNQSRPMTADEREATDSFFDSLMVEDPPTTNPTQISNSVVDESPIRTDLERNLLSLLLSPRYSGLSLDQIRTLASGYVTQGNTLERTEAEIRQFIADALKTPRIERR